MDKTKIFHIKPSDVGRAIKIRFLPNYFDIEHSFCSYTIPNLKQPVRPLRRFLSYAFIDDEFCVFHYGETIWRYFSICPDLFLLNSCYYMIIDVHMEKLEYDDTQIGKQNPDDLFYDYTTTMKYVRLECNLGVDEKHKYLGTPENKEYFDNLYNSVDKQFRLENLSKAFHIKHQTTKLSTS